MKRLILSLIFLFSLVFLVLFFGNDLTSSFEESPDARNETNSRRNLEENSSASTSRPTPSVSEECEDYKKSLSDPKYENLENRRWSNYHIKYVDGEIYRIRYFYDDGPNGEYKKTILYKEDETEFPHIVKIFRGFEKKELKDYFDRGEIIWQEQAYEALMDKKTIYWRKINDEFVDLNIDEGLSCL